MNNYRWNSTQDQAEQLRLRKAYVERVMAQGASIEEAYDMLDGEWQSYQQYRNVCETGYSDPINRVR